MRAHGCSDEERFLLSPLHFRGKWLQYRYVSWGELWLGVKFLGDRRTTEPFPRAP